MKADQVVENCPRRLVAVVARVVVAGAPDDRPQEAVGVACVGDKVAAVAAAEQAGNSGRRPTDSGVFSYSPQDFQQAVR